MVGGTKEGPVEVEGEPAFSLTLGQLPGVRAASLHGCLMHITTHTCLDSS